MKPGQVIIQDRTDDAEGRWLYFAEPAEVAETYRVDEVLVKLAAVEKAVERGLHAAGFISYEAAPAFDTAFRVRPPSPLPLLWFGLYRKVEKLQKLPLPASRTFTLGEWIPSISQEEYRKAIEQIKNYIARGETYQVNYTFRLQTKFTGDPFALWLKLIQAQPRGYAAYLDTGRFFICSVSPELFFLLNGSELISRPMKGTATRGRTIEQDREKIQWLKKSEKNRAENLMIVDMVRNDMGRIAETGSVSVPSLFDIERYPTVLQMTSTVKSETSSRLSEIFTALFPCASITGAPKIRTMEIIAELENAPRGVYTGCIGFVSPERKAQFNVAIRTVQIDRKAGTADYGVGGGIVWDSESVDEYSECLIKSRVLITERPDFELLESFLWEKGTGYFLLERHLKRLVDSGEYFGYPVDTELVRNSLLELAKFLDNNKYKVRLRVDKNSEVYIDSEPLDEEKNRRTWRLGLAAEPVDPENPFLYHKTTNRKLYEDARASCPEYDDVLLWNRRREITESTIANVVVKIGEKYFTPPVECGLLPGTYRASLLEEGRIREKVITLDDLKKSKSIYLINSVRKWLKARLEI